MQEQLSSHRTSIPSNMFWKTLVYRLKFKCLTGSRRLWFGLMPLPVHAFLFFVLPIPSLHLSFIWPACIHPPRLYPTMALTKWDRKHLPSSCIALQNICCSKTRTHHTHPCPQTLAQCLRYNTQLKNGWWINNEFSFTTKISSQGWHYIKLPNELCL